MGYEARVPDFFSEMISFASDSNFNQTCNVVLAKNQTFIEIDRGWAGIPETLVINLVLSSLLIFPFFLIRNFANSRLETNSWLQFIYGDRTDTTNPLENKTHLQNLNYSDRAKIDQRTLLPIHITKCKERHIDSSSSSEAISPSNPSTSTELNTKTVNFASDTNEEVNSDDIIVIQPHLHRGSSDNLVLNETTFPVDSTFSSAPNRFHFFRSDSIYAFNSWLSRFFQLTEISVRKGPDAYQYLQFQQYIIAFLCVLSFVCIVILLPINVQANYDGKAFARTTLSNLSNDSNWFWFHAISATFISIMGVYFMNYFSKILKTEDDLMSRTTLLFRRIPIPQETEMKQTLLDYFHQQFPQVTITGIQLIYDYRRLEELEQDYVNAMNAKQFCEHYNGKHHNPIDLRPYTLGRFACCCCCCNKVDGLEYYTQEQEKINGKINKELEKMGRLPPGTAFVNFETEKMTMEVYKYFKEEQRKFGLCPSCITHCFSGEIFDLKRSIVTYAPYPYDINWLNIGVDMNLLWLRKILLSLLLFVIFFFLSTPSFLVYIFDYVANKDLIKNGIGRLGSTFTDFLSPFLLMILAIILPSIVTVACQYIPYKTISALNHAIMSKVFAFLLMMILILPSAGFLSINAMLEDILNPMENKRQFRWNCLFPVDNGAFFVIYTLQGAILGNTVELLRIPELCLYVLNNVILRSPAEFETARKKITFEFPFGVSYARFLLIFTITVTYSHACPLIAPCGLLYMVGKHLVDRYNIYHVYTPSKINGRIHSTAILYVHISLIMMLFQVFTYLLTKTQYTKVTIYSLVVLLISLLVFAFHCFYHWFRNINHLTYGVTTRLSKKGPKHNFCICSYKPPVFSDIFTDNPTKSQ